MRTHLSACLTILAGILVSACLTCSNKDCLESGYTGYFRVVDATTGTDLAFGPGRRYRSEKIRFYALRGTDTTFLEYRAAPLPYARDSILRVQFYPRVGVAYMRLNNRDTDTLAISYNAFATECCGTITEITKFRLNNRTDIPGNQGTQLIKK